MHYRRTTVKQMKSWLHSLWWRVGGVARGAGEESALNPAVVVCRGLPRAAEGCRRPGSVLGHFFSHFRNTRAVESTWAADSHMPQHSNKS